MKKINIILLTCLLTIVLLVVEIIIVRNVSRYEPQVSVVYTKAGIPEKTVITEDMIEKRKVAFSIAHRQSIRTVDNVVGKIAGVDLEEGEMILSSRLCNDDMMEEIKVVDKNNRLFTVEFKGDQANGWWLMEGQYVDIIYIPDERTKTKDLKDTEQLVSSEEPDDEFIIQYISSIKRLKNIRIAALIDDKGKILGNSERTVLPKFVSFEVTDKQDEFLAYAKTNGRLEISVVPGFNK